MKPTLDAWLRSDRLRRADAALGRWLARAFSDAPPEVALAAALAARAVGDGHSALELARTADWLSKLEGSGKPPALPQPAAWQAALRAAPDACAHGAGNTPAPLTLDAQGRVYLSRYFDAEQRVAQVLTIHANDGGRPARSPVPGPRSRTDGLDPAQQRAIAVAMAHRFTLITGGPGSGKTFSVAHILAALLRDAPARTALAAPTGKAAARLAESLRAQVACMELPEAIAESIPRDASTLHRLLGISPWRARPRHHCDAPLPFDIVVVDEASMVDLPLMARLTDALAPDARLILLGDPDQLSAVEAGNVLPALVEAASEPPFEACHVALAHSHRFGSDSTLGQLARAIVAGDAGAALASLQANEAVARLIEDDRDSALIAEAHAGYVPILAAADPAAALAAARGFRVITALRHGPHGCLALNRGIEARLKRACGLRGDDAWWPGRLLMVTSNRDELALYNGDTGVVWPGADGSMQVWFEGADGPRAFAPAALPPFEGAFALTVHKAQGSEFERVALVTGPESPVLTRELLYTGVTRARSGIVIHSTADTLCVGIGNRTLRMTGLADRLREAAAGT